VRRAPGAPTGASAPSLFVGCMWRRF
jgi:hypothetical protein